MTSIDDSSRSYAYRSDDSTVLSALYWLERFDYRCTGDDAVAVLGFGNNRIVIAPINATAVNV